MEHGDARLWSMTLGLCLVRGCSCTALLFCAEVKGVSSQPGCSQLLTLSPSVVSVTASLS
eukprot:364496-Chlamydomonas_euryale.AAC.32